MKKQSKHNPYNSSYNSRQTKPPSNLSKGSVADREVSAWMSQFRDISESTVMEKKKLPDSEAVWNAALVYGNSKDIRLRKTVRPLLTGQIMTFLLGAGTFIFLFFLFRGGINSFFQTATVGHIISVFLKGANFVLTLNPLAVPVFISLFIYMVFSELKKTMRHMIARH